ncbi:MAG: hypothetical protein K6G05_06550 [Lachnospiraceae bacterium]|nr:hypothetical protein [Lachnospiraceae bacterium]
MSTHWKCYRKLLFVVTLILIIIFGNGCSKTSSKANSSKKNTDKDTINENGSNEDSTVDLTTLSSTMVYSEVYNMLINPTEYIGKTVKMEGQFRVYHDESTNKYYFACIISDATACCTQGIEFELAGDFNYPDDYPAEGSDICVTGVFDTYQEDESTYCVLRDASLYC